MHPDCLVAELADAAEAVADEDDRPRLGAELAHLREGLLLEARVPGREGLVDQEDVGLHVDRNGEREPAVHARRVGAHRHVDEVTELREVGDLLELGCHLLSRQAGREPAEDHVLPSREIVLEADAEREEGADPPGDLDAALGRRQDPGHRSQERRLAGPVDADDAEAALDRIDRSHLEAARDLGASPWSAFRTVTLPLSKTGILGGADYRRWNPATDRFLSVHYGPETLERKTPSRDALLAQLEQFALAFLERGTQLRFNCARHVRNVFAFKVSCFSNVVVLGKDLSIILAERRAIALANPSLGGRPFASPTLWAAIQYLMPGEDAPEHREVVDARARAADDGAEARSRLQQQP